MSEIGSSEDIPPAANYPHGDAFPILLSWHLDFGTRPTGHPSTPGKPWTNQTFGEAVGGHDGKTVSNWRMARNHPQSITNIETTLFGTNEAFNAWRMDLRSAYNSFNVKSKRSQLSAFSTKSDIAINYSPSDMYRQAEKDIIQGRLTDLRYAYIGPSGASNWLELTRNPQYEHHQLMAHYIRNSLEITKLLPIVGKDVTFLSLGPGDGRIDIALLSAIQLVSKNLNYCPLDISLELLQETIRNFRAAYSITNSIEMNPILGDFTKLSEHKDRFSSANSVIFSIIGYSFGNYDEHTILNNIKENMTEEKDILMLDVRLHHLGSISGEVTPSAREAITRNYRSPLASRFSFGPLETLTDCDWDEGNFGQRVTTDNAIVPSSIKLTIFHKKIRTRLRRRGPNDVIDRSQIDLATTTTYDQEALKIWLTERGMIILGQYEFDDTLVLILTKRKFL